MAPKCTDVGIQYLAKNCPHLEIITLINGAVVEITDLAIEALSKHCINLKFLSFETSSSVSLTCLKSIGNRLHDLQTLIIVDNKNFVNKECINKGLKAIAEGCKKLKKIAFAAFRNEYDDEHLIKLIQANPYLEFAAIYCQSDSVINAFDKHCPCLNYLIIKTMFNSLDITIETLEKLVKNRPTISIEYKNKMLAHKGKLFLKA